ncbi:MAG: FAD-dependent oxidoreductase [Firmicutes bacterium]|nr:FAD-dependent oxidoreductase [Bacillota bacterium]
MTGYRVDLAVIGGGVGGCAAALAAAHLGKRVILTEETDWIGGQLTSQAVPPDEHPWIEQFGCTANYRKFREGVRDYYRRHFPITSEARSNPRLNPGNGRVSRLCHEPRAALAVLNQMLAPYIHSGRVVLLLNHRAVSCQVVGDRVESVLVRNLITGNDVTLEAPYFLDATELGDLLPMSGTEYVVGAESQNDTGEPHAVPGPAEPHNQQAFTFCFAMDYMPGSDNTIAKPDDYEFWRDYQADFWPDKHLSWVTSNPITLKPYYHSLFQEPNRHSLWNYRQILDKDNFAAGAFETSVTLVNWPQNDYWLGPLCDVSEAEAEKHRVAAKNLSLSLLYWMQTEAPRFDGGIGYPELRLRKDVVGTEDGLAKYPYVRESRRIKAEFTVLEQHVASEIRGERGAERFSDSVGVGCYRIDLHPSTNGVDYIDVGSWPFQIPLGALLPVRMENLLPACKNLGVTHVTNGCYRLHPVEWNIGEAAGYLAAYSLDRGIKPRAVRDDPEHLAGFQDVLVKQGVELEWPKLRSV